jgi:hypothetical protein
VLLLERLTTNPPVGGAALRVTVQASVPAPVNEALAQESAERPAVETPEPLKLTTADGLVEELLETVRVPVNEPALVGRNCTLNVADWPGARVTGGVTPDALKSEPTIEMPEMATDAVPVEVSVTGSVAACPAFALPKARLEVLMLSVGVPGFTVNVTDFVALA